MGSCSKGFSEKGEDSRPGDMSGILKKGEQTYRLPQVYPRMVIPETEMPAKVVRWEKLEIIGKVVGAEL